MKVARPVNRKKSSNAEKEQRTLKEIKEKLLKGGRAVVVYKWSSEDGEKQCEIPVFTIEEIELLRGNGNSPDCRKELRIQAGDEVVRYDLITLKEL
jgi:hypothetical protein